MSAQLAAVYFFGGIAKLNPDWLFAALPMKIWLYQHGDFFLVGRLLQQTWVAYAMSWVGAVYDLTIVGWLLWIRTRPFAFIVLIIFHLMTWQLFPALGMFPWLMMGSMLLFFAPDWPRRLARIVNRTASHLRDNERPIPQQSESMRHLSNQSAETFGREESPSLSSQYSPSPKSQSPYATEPTPATSAGTRKVIASLGK